ncbi:MAG TPA: Nramp family divalent metal transporter [Longimicrobiales bacterium]|nr:Nramp family divalent metal transporter [Longimicrobiales bacterium]
MADAAESGRSGGRRWRGVGPGAIVAAAFIGPGTVTTATLAGAGYGYALLWALSFSILATLVLQEMSARLGIVTGQGLGEAIRSRFTAGAARVVALVLIVSAIAIGNAAYEAGNLLGATLGMRGVVGGTATVWVPVFAGLAFALLWTGRYRAIEGVMIAMVVIMSVVFLATALVLAPAPGDVLRGLLVPTVPDDGRALLLALALVGTTVVPYNLFLHAAAVGERFGGPEDLPAARLDLGVAIVGGGIVSMAIVVTAAAAFHHAGPGAVASASDMAATLEPLLGRWARAFFAAGLFAAGMTSAITAPLAAAYAVAGALGWPRDLRDRRLRMVWGSVLLAGVPFAIAGTRPTIPLGFGEVSVIVFAQVANGILLPAMAVFLLVAVNDRVRMGGRSNGVVLNVLGGLVVLVTVLIGGTAIWRALG